MGYGDRSIGWWICRTYGGVQSFACVFAGVEVLVQVLAICIFLGEMDREGKCLVLPLDGEWN